MKQQSLFDKNIKRIYARTEHGGDIRKDLRKLERPFARRKWLHVVLKSDKAKGKLSLKSARSQTFIESLVFSKAKRFGVDIGDYVNVGDHLHIQVRASCKTQFQKWLKSITGTIARYVTGARRGKPFGRFWNSLAYSRVVRTSFELRRVWNYFCANRLESVAGHARREEYLRDTRQSMRNWNSDRTRTRMQTFEEYLASSG